MKKAFLSVFSVHIHENDQKWTSLTEFDISIPDIRSTKTCPKGYFRAFYRYIPEKAMDKFLVHLCPDGQVGQNLLLKEKKIKPKMVL